jgi:hypothetical protein
MAVRVVVAATPIAKLVVLLELAPNQGFAGGTNAVYGNVGGGGGAGAVGGGGGASNTAWWCWRCWCRIKHHRVHQ